MIALNQKNNDQAKRFQAIQLKAHLKMLACGMKNSQFSGKQILAKATEITGVDYKRGRYRQAIEDLINFLEGKL